MARTQDRRGASWEEIKAERGEIPEQTPEYWAERSALAVGRMLRRLRSESGLTQTELADKLGVRQPNIARIEAGISVPTLETAHRIAEALNHRVVFGILTEADIESSGIRKLEEAGLMIEMDG